MKRLFAGAAVLVAGLVLPVTAAGGDAPSHAGWWTSQNPGPSPGPVPTLVPDQSSVANPDVPPGGFEVEDLDGTRSYAALSYDLPEGGSVRRVELKLASGAAHVPGSAVQACVLVGEGRFADAAGGPLESGPAYDCATARPGVEDAAGTISFVATHLAVNHRLAVAIVPVGRGRLVFAKPDATTLDIERAAQAGPQLAPTPVADAEVAVADPVAAFGEPPASADGVPAPSATAAGRRDLTVAALATRSPHPTRGAAASVVGGLLMFVAAGRVAARNRRALAVRR